MLPASQDAIDLTEDGLGCVTACAVLWVEPRLLIASGEGGAPVVRADSRPRGPAKIIWGCASFTR